MSDHRMPRLLAAAACLGMSLAAGNALAQANISIASPYGQTFDTLASSGTSNPWTDNATLPGWYSARALQGTTAVYIANRGNTTNGTTYSFGSDGQSDRALGSIPSNATGSICQGLQLVNADSVDFDSVGVSYTGEQWRNGNNVNAQTLAVHYRIAPAGTPFSLDCGSDTGWTAATALDFTSPITGAAIAVLDGNDPANQIAISHTLGLTLAAGDQLWLRWTDVNDSGNDHGLSIDNLLVTASGAGPALPLISFDANPLSAPEGNTGDANTLDFIINIDPAPQPGSPLNFDLAVSGDAGRYDDSAVPASLSVDENTALPLTVSVAIIGNDAVDGDSTVTLSLSNISGAAGTQDDPLEKDGVILDDDVAALPLVSFADGELSVQEGDSGDANPITFTVNVSPAPLPGAPLSFDVEADGPTGAYTYGGPSSVEVTDQTALPLTFTLYTVGNDEDGADSEVLLRLSNFSGGDAGQPSPLVKTASILDDDLPISEIFDIQGAGECSPLFPVCNGDANLTGPSVRARANIVTALAPNGFFMQTPDARDDGDPLTSNGLFVFTAAAPQTDDAQALAVGDEVEVIGNVAEYFNMTQIVVSTTRGPDNRIVRSAAGQPLPAAIAFGEAGIPSKDPDNLSCGDSNFECFEGMRVSIANGAVTVSNQRRSGVHTYAEAWASPYGERGVREKGVLFGVPIPAGSPAAGRFDGNPEILELDADHLVAEYAGELVGGTRFSAEGVIGYDFGDYEFWPSSFTVEPDTNVLPRPVPPAAAGELTIGSFNAFRLCDAVAGNTVSRCAATNALETDTTRVAHETGQISAYIREVLGSPAVVAVQEVENLAVLQILADQIASDDGPSYDAYLVEGNDVGGIDVGYLVDGSRVVDAEVEQLAGDETWLDPESAPAPRLLHDRPPLLLTASFIGNGRPYTFQVLNNHTRSRIGLEDGDADSERTRAKRFTQALSIANIVQDLQSAPETAALPLFVIGDYNAYQFTDGYADVVGLIAGTYVNDENSCAPTGGITDCKLPGGQNIVDPPLINAVLLLDESEQYSYKYTEDFGAIQGSNGRDLPVNQVLDHALFNEAARPHVSGMAYGRANVDASIQRFDKCNYRNRDLDICPQGPDANPPAPWQPVGASDHDGLVIYVSPPRPEAIFADGFEDD